MRVLPRVGLTLGPKLRHPRRAFDVLVEPGTPGEPVLLQRKVDRRWRTVTIGTLSLRDRARLVATVPRGRSVWRAKVKTTDDHWAGKSLVVRVRS